jgi:hypothetical protein
MSKGLERLSSREYNALRSLLPDSLLRNVENAIEDYLAHSYRISEDDIEYYGDEHNRAGLVSYAYQRLRELGGIAYNVRGELSSILDQFALAEKSDIHIFGSAGVGKTHLACHICEYRLEHGLPALLIPGNRFTSDQPLETQVRHILDIPPSYTWNDVVWALDAAAQAYKTRIPLVFEGINEAVYQGALSQVWALGLPGFIDELSRFASLVLITTCRTSYREAIWPERQPENQLVVSGFDYDDIDEAVTKYFEWYRIHAEVTLAPLSHFRLPIYLKLFCETKNPERDHDEYLYVGEETLFEVFDEYLDLCNERVSRRLRRHISAGLVSRSLAKLVKIQWDQQTRLIPLNEAYLTVDGRPLSDLDLERSLTSALLDESLLVAQDWSSRGEVIVFTYDLLGGYLIARQLLEEHGDNLESFLRDSNTSKRLFGGDYRDLHPLHEDIVRCLAALLPRASGRYLHEFSDLASTHWFSLASLFEIDPALVSDRAVDFVASRFDEEEARARLLELAMPSITHIGHPLNAEFWSRALHRLSLPDRDLSWSEHVRHNLDWYEGLVAKFLKACQADSISELGEQRVHLLAPILRWCLTSTIRRLRDRTTRALYYYGRRWPQRILDLTVQSFLHQRYIRYRTDAFCSLWHRNGTSPGLC